MTFYSAIDPTLWRLIGAWRDAKHEIDVTNSIREINLYVADLKRQIVDANFENQRIKTEIERLRARVK